VVSDVLEYLASGMRQEDILADFPDLRVEHLSGCLELTRQQYVDEERLSESIRLACSVLSCVLGVSTL